MATTVDYKQTYNKQINNTHDNKISQTMSFKQSINVHKSIFNEKQIICTSREVA